MLELRGISKNFGTFSALSQVDFDVQAGEIVGLLGENGAGKSTLLSIVGGSLTPTKGELLWKEKPAVLASPRDANRLGIGVVHQHFKLVPSFSVAENIALYAAQGGFIFDEREWRERIRGWAQQLGWRIDPARRIEELSVGERQRVEILKALFVHEGGEPAQLLLLDEPTTNLTPGEVRELFGVLRRLRDMGRAIVFVSHKLKEVLALCDRVVVLRRGRLVGKRNIGDTTADELAELMVGRSLAPHVEEEYSAHRLAAKEVGLAITGLSAGLLRNINLQVQHGEIVGIAGVDGNGQAELSEVLAGLREPDSGTFTPQSSVAVIPPDRQHVGLIPTFSLSENLALHPALRRQCKRPLGFDWRYAKQRTRELMAAFDVRAPATQESTPATQLSGGNQQKLVIARALSFPHTVVVAADPTRGLDVAAARFIHAQLKQAAGEGAAVLLISTDLDEIFALSDRIGVLYEGRLLPGAELLPRGANRDEVGRLMGGVAEGISREMPK